MAPVSRPGAHLRLVLNSYEKLLGRLLMDLPAGAELQAALDEAPFCLVSHDTSADPVFNYANRQALRLFDMSLAEFTALPSRYSAQPLHRDERARFLRQVSEAGFVTGYQGIRISSRGQRFRIEDGTVWNCFDDQGRAYGQAACFSRWTTLSD